MANQRLCTREEHHRARLFVRSPWVLLDKGSSYSPTIIASGFLVDDTAAPKLEVTRVKILSCSPRVWTSFLWKPMIGISGRMNCDYWKRTLACLWRIWVSNVQYLAPQIERIPELGSKGSTENTRREIGRQKVKKLVGATVLVNMVRKNMLEVLEFY